MMKFSFSPYLMKGCGKVVKDDLVMFKRKAINAPMRKCDMNVN